METIDTIDTIDTMNTDKRYIFWLDDLTVLYKDSNYIKFIPTPNMTRVEQLNALSRFSMYSIILLTAFGKTDSIIYIPIVGLIVLIILYNVFKVDEKGKKQELLRMKRKIKSPVTSEPEINYRTYIVDVDGESRVVDIDDLEQAEYEADLDPDQDTKYNLEAGYIDSNGDLQYGSNYRATSAVETDADKIDYNLDELRLYQQNTCRKPTKDNPFMNSSVADFNTNAVMPCAVMPHNADDEDIHNDVELKFNEDMYRDLEDIFNRKNSQRQFFSIAHNIPNDQEAFARWNYKMPATCKTDQSRCLKYQDLRYKY